MQHSCNMLVILHVLRSNMLKKLVANSKGGQANLSLHSRTVTILNEAKELAKWPLHVIRQR